MQAIDFTSNFKTREPDRGAGPIEIWKYEGFQPCLPTGAIHIASGGFAGRLKAIGHFDPREGCGINGGPLLDLEKDRMLGNV